MTVIARFSRTKVIGLILAFAFSGAWTYGLGTKTWEFERSSRGLDPLLMGGAVTVALGFVLLRILMWRGPALAISGNTLRAFDYWGPKEVAFLADASPTDGSVRDEAICFVAYTPSGARHRVSVFWLDVDRHTVSNRIDAYLADLAGNAR